MTITEDMLRGYRGVLNSGRAEVDHKLWSPTRIIAKDAWGGIVVLFRSPKGEEKWTPLLRA